MFSRTLTPTRHHTSNRCSARQLGVLKLAHGVLGSEHRSANK